MYIASSPKLHFVKCAFFGYYYIDIQAISYKRFCFSFARDALKYEIIGEQKAEYTEHQS